MESDNLRATVPFVFYIKNSLRFWYYASLSTSRKKIWVTGKIWEKAVVKLLRDLAEKSINLLLWELPTSGFCYFLVKRISKHN